MIGIIRREIRFLIKYGEKREEIFLTILRR